MVQRRGAGRGQLEEGEAGEERVDGDVIEQGAQADPDRLRAARAGSSSAAAKRPATTRRASAASASKAATKASRLLGKWS